MRGLARFSVADHELFIEIRDFIKLLGSVIDMAFGLQFKHDYHTTAINRINAQLEEINLQVTFASEQGRLEMTHVWSLVTEDFGP